MQRFSLPQGTGDVGAVPHFLYFNRSKSVALGRCPGRLSCQHKDECFRIEATSVELHRIR